MQTNKWDVLDNNENTDNDYFNVIVNTRGYVKIC